MNLTEQLQTTVRAGMESLDLTATDLARRIHVAPKTVRRALTGEHVPAMVTWQAMLDGLGLEVTLTTKPVRLTEEQLDIAAERRKEQLRKRGKAFGS